MPEKPRSDMISSEGQAGAAAQGGFEVETSSSGPTEPKDKVTIDEQYLQEALSPEDWIQAQQSKKESDIAPLRAELQEKDAKGIKTERAKQEPPQLSKDAQSKMAPEAQRIYGTLPERRQGLFASLREKIGLGKDAVKALAAAMEYYKKQDQALKEADAKIESLAKQLIELAGSIDKFNYDVARISQDLEQAQTALSSTGLKGPLMDNALKQARTEADREISKLKDQQRKCAEQRNKVQDQLEVTQNVQERFAKAREKAKSELDEAAIRAINANAQDTEQLEGRTRETRHQAWDNQDARKGLNSKITELQITANQMQDSTQSATLNDLLQRTIEQAKTLTEQQDKLHEEIKQLDTSLTEHEKINENTVSLLSQEKITELLQAEENYWIAPLLENRQLQALDRDTIVKLVQSRNVPKDRLFPKLDQIGLLDGLIADKTITQSREKLIALGLLKKPADTATAETTKKKIPFVKEKERFSDYLGRKERFGGVMDDKLGDIVAAWNAENPELKITLADKESPEQTISNSNAKLEILRLAKKQHPQQEQAAYKKADEFFLALKQEERIISPEQHRQQATIPKNDTLKNWKQRLSETELPLKTDSASDDESFGDDEVMDILYDQAVGKADEKLRESAKKRFAKFLIETFGPLRGRIVKESVNTAAREKFADVVEGWNTEQPDLKINQVPRELQERSLSRASIEVEIVRLAEGDIPNDLHQRVENFLHKREEARRAQAAQEAQASTAATA